MASPEGPLYTGTGANYNDGGNVAWSNPTNVQGDTTSTAATCNPNGRNNTSQRLRCSNFGFSIPSGATIDGVEVEVEQQAAAANRHSWSSVNLLVAGAETGDDKSDGSLIPTTKGFKTFGGSADAWNAGLDAAKVNATGFGVSLKIYQSGNVATTTSLFRVRITVYYTEAPTQSAVGANRQAGGGWATVVRKAVAVAAVAAIAGGAPEASRKVFAGAANKTFGAGSATVGQAGQDVFAEAGAGNEQSASGAPTKDALASAAGWNRQLAGGVSRDVVFVQAEAGAGNRTSGGGFATRERAATAASSAGTRAGGLSKADRAGAGAGTNGQIAGALAEADKKAVAGAGNADRAGTFGSRDVPASGAGANGQVAGAFGYAIQYVPAAIERIVDYRNHGLMVDRQDYIRFGAIYIGDFETWLTPTDHYGYNEIKSGSSTIFQDHNGHRAYGARFTIDASNNGAHMYPATTIMLIPERRMRIRVWYRTLDAASEAFVQLRSSGNQVYFQPDGSWSATQSVIVLPPTSGIWTKYEIDFNVHASYSGYYFVFGAGAYGGTGSAAANGTICFDDCSLFPVDDGFNRIAEFKAEQGFDPSLIKAGLIANSEMTSWQTLTNLANWTEVEAGSSTINREDIIFVSSPYSCRFAIDALNSRAEIYQDISGIVSEKRYRAEFMYRTEAGKKIKPYVRVWMNLAYHFLQADGSWKKSGDPGYSESYRGDGLESADIWTKDAMSFVCPISATHRFGLFNGDAASGNLYADDFYVYGAFEIESTTAIVEARDREKEIEIK